MFASKSAIESESSANAGSNALRGNVASPSPAVRAESRNDDREDGLNGVVGLGVREREPERFAAGSVSSDAMIV